MAEYAKGQHIRGAQRQELAKWLVARYEDGDSIRTLADATGRSFTFIRNLLVEADVQLRARGGTASQPRPCLTDETARQRWAAGTEAVRKTLAKELPERYEAGETIRELAAATGWSYGVVHRVLVEARVRRRLPGRRAGR